ncbi:unnamed protein product [Pelagomonas calceolata]|jgi:solute carrier family 25 carnitine/acylcarnitine transporter 20/29|uniref:Mitochondrial carrier protein n=1 Tax=Pelagomonas calceolata TaxID=35677 RepID=A0A6U1HJ29_9STRA|nr:unnamed protein product [Pelagomonas calceolata]|tara:strand:- start:125 stop:943 length:819 start_codon:yes stop_codon:yes gene_type:complete|mmetsp:Transcript_22916/g.64415  ORF Transcript_22916/g.64415 Transcript_22916/m.64415 type:complete len:273 (+) Transcript_22916:175-993(+)
MGDAEQALLKMSPVENAAVGVGAGTIEVIALQPILYWKNATQQGLPLSLNPRMLYRGLSTSVVNMATLTGLQFPLTGAVAKAITGGEERPLGDGEKVGAAFCGGFISGLACGPFELTMIQQQRFGGSIVGTPARLISTFGLGGMSRGLLMSCGREGIYTAGVLGTCPVFIDKFKARGFSTNQAKMGGAICAGVMSASLSHPMDTVKSCLQGDIEQKTYTSNAGTFRTLWAEGGASRFFSGYLFRTGRMILAVGIMNECKLRLSPLLFPHHFA